MKQNEWGHTFDENDDLTRFCDIEGCQTFFVFRHQVDVGILDEHRNNVRPSSVRRLMQRRVSFLVSLIDTCSMLQQELDKCWLPKVCSHVKRCPVTTHEIPINSPSGGICEHRLKLLRVALACS